MTKKPTSIADAIAKKRAPSPSIPDPLTPPPAQTASQQSMRMLSFRAPEIVIDQLKDMAYHGKRSQQALVNEALNLLFEKHGKPPVAPDR